ncbi:MAG: hypothetical protein WAW75_10945 [Gallionella sp.]
MNCKSSCGLRCGKFIILAVLGIAALGWVVMMLWNWLMPALFVDGRKIGYLQALGLLVLSKILFGGFRGHGCHGRWHRNRLENMAPDEREKFQAGMHGWFCKGKGESAETKE